MALNDMPFHSHATTFLTEVPDALVLAGGLGTRLRSVVADLPKCMAPVAGRPFLAFVIDALRRQGVRRFVFSLGYKHELITAYLEKEFPTLEYSIVVEPEPLGTGGAIRLACSAAKTKDVVVVNGDTLFEVSLAAMMEVHNTRSADATLALKPMRDFDRYGVVELDDTGKIIRFREKQQYKEGLINGGVYLLNRERFLNLSLPEKFSFEKEYLEDTQSGHLLYGVVQDGYFIDIGIPEDFEKAGRDLQRPPLNLGAIDSTWSLFLDRDGVLNVERPGHYILNWEGFVFEEGLPEVFPLLNRKFGRVFVVTNQRGIGRSLMTEEDLKRIHNEMVNAIEGAGGHIDALYYCTEVDNRCFDRKPNPGMALKAQRDFPELDLKRSVMVGNKPSDMRFGRAAGMYTVFIATTNPDQPFPHPDIDLFYPSLAAFARALELG
ncbi:MAG TPA: HAD-IIIA family hydrolase [Chitinophagaceae bacterium]|jgi:D-glycero-alpha-D-manno-heptose 1-phosphate guanylyltransferase|nr:HAD-IIIA family hydrolase [Chitinophagaceae bacterium]